MGCALGVGIELLKVNGTLWVDARNERKVTAMFGTVMGGLITVGGLIVGKIPFTVIHIMQNFLPFMGGYYLCGDGTYFLMGKNK